MGGGGGEPDSDASVTFLSHREGKGEGECENIVVKDTGLRKFCFQTRWGSRGWMYPLNQNNNNKRTTQ